MKEHNLNLSHNIYKDAKRGTYYFRIKYYDKKNQRKEIKRVALNNVKKRWRNVMKLWTS